MSASQERNLRSGATRPSERGESSSHTTYPSANTQLAQDIATANALRSAGAGPEGSQADAGEEQGDPMDEAGTDSDSEGGKQGNIDFDEEFEDLKRQAARKRREKEKKALRRYLSDDDPSLSITIQSEHYGNPENLNKRKRKQRATSNGEVTAKTMRTSSFRSHLAFPDHAIPTLFLCEGPASSQFKGFESTSNGRNSIFYPVLIDGWVPFAIECLSQCAAFNGSYYCSHSVGSIVALSSMGN
jgi:hypothetical protein